MLKNEALIQETTFKAIRSSGAGGQHVNKVSSKIELTFDVMASLVLSEAQKMTIVEKLQHRLTKHHVLILQCDQTRSQHKNKELVIQRFFELISNALIISKKRIPTKIPKAVIRKRLKNKRNLSLKKSNRKKPDVD